MSDVPSILIVDDEPVARSRLRELLADLAPDFPHRIVGEAPNAPEALSQIEVAQPQIVLLDIQMPGINGIEGVKVLRRHFVSARIVIVSGTSGLDAIPPEARRDIAGFLSKSADAREIEEAIVCCMSGGTHFCPSGCATTEAGVYQASSLTPRQLEVLSQLNLGRSNKVIAHHLGLSENTVRVHVAAILDHLGVVSRVEAILEAQRRGLVQAQR